MTVAVLFRRACANEPAQHLLRMRSSFRRLSETLLAETAGDRDAIDAALGDLRRQRLILDDDFSETRFKLDAGLVRLERDVKEALNESHEPF